MIISTFEFWLLWSEGLRQTQTKDKQRQRKTSMKSPVNSSGWCVSLCSDSDFNSTKDSHDDDDDDDRRRRKTFAEEEEIRRNKKKN